MLDSSYTFERFSSIPQNYEDILLKGISENAYEMRGLQPFNPFSVFIKDSMQQVVGGVLGVTFYGSLYVDSLWIDKTLRKKGLGTLLMQEVEKLAIVNQARFITLNTMDFEGLNFYQKLGFTIEFIREGYDKDSKMYLLRKQLI